MDILLVEDDQPIRVVLAEVLSSQQYVVDVATDGETGLKLARAKVYDLLLLDVMLPKLNGIGLCKLLRAEGYQNPILLLTGKDSSGDRVAGLDAGADDYVVKPFDIQELLARVRALTRRSHSAPSTVTTWENVQLDATNSEVSCNGQRLNLTPKEFCLLELFFGNPKRVFSRSAILDRLWDVAESPGEETVSTHIKCLRQKLKAAGATDPIETVHGLGYRLRQAGEGTGSREQGVGERELRELREQDKSQVTSHKSQVTIQPHIHPTPYTSHTSHTSHTLHPTPHSRLPTHQVQSRTAKVWERHKDKIVAQVAVLGQAARALVQNELTPQLRQQAHAEAHKLAGSLGIFGLMAGTHLARELELLLHPDIMLETAQSQQIAVLAQLLQQELVNPAVPTATVIEPQSADRVPLILIVDDDLMLAERVRVEAIAWGMRVEVVTDLDVARQTIAQTPPDAVLLDLNFPSAQEDGMTLLRELANRFPTILAIAFTGRESLADRVAVAQLGGCAFLHKPLPTYEILKAVTEALKLQRQKSGNRVMLVDDDPVILEILSEQLHNLEIEVTSLKNPKQFWQVFTTFAPDLLVLDMQMPHFDGVQLCQVVRTDPHWHHLPILFLSISATETEIARAFAAGADDYISKSTDGMEIATRITRRLRREQRSLGDEATTNPSRQRKN
ncbi:MAG: Regulator of RpoS [Chroococcidiopsis sp. SAG 2025]|uniref:response regulator n=1 Tax=Chroococcidiopsis sp. SAG 2025 TaxID=171389 RepID=UPI0029373C08|nr:response regulator [Chroococcidiopsis sp. SAG 2025]MDV2992933.1 Regulator of RpoS [Chroococcidiopsis sp. SAG 2025]